MQDLESSVYYAFTHEIAKFQVITDELLPVLKNYTAVLSLVGGDYHYTRRNSVLIIEEAVSPY